MLQKMLKKMILGNKCDMTDKRVITLEQGQKLAAEHKVPFMETSAKANINIEEAFVQMARAIKKKMDHKEVSTPRNPSKEDTTVRKIDDTPKSSGGGCC